MCSFAVLGALLMPVALATQTPATLEQRMRQLESLRRTAAAALARADSARREPLDTIVTGSLVVIGRPSDAGLIRAAARVAWARLDSLYGAAATQLAGQPMVFFQQRFPITDTRPEMSRLQRVMVLQNATTPDAAFQLVRGGSAVIAAGTDRALAEWLGAQLLADVPLPLLESRVYVDLVTAPSSAVRHCFTGALEACRAALGLAVGDPALVWYDAAERRGLVQEQQAVARGLHIDVDRCVVNESDSACIDALRGLYLPPPLSTEARQTLVRLALAAGGREAFRRLEQSAGQPLAQRVALAGGEPLDSLLRHWRADVLAARPRPVTLSAAIGWTALGWTLLFGVLAMRSTRWR
jgi:hypothetical protein